MLSPELIGVSEEFLEELRLGAPTLPLKTLRELKVKCERKLLALRRTYPESAEVSYAGPINPADELDQIRFHQQVIDLCNGQIADRGRMSLNDLERQRDALLQAFPDLRKRRLTIDPPLQQELYDEIQEGITRLKLREIQKPKKPGQRATDGEFAHSEDYRTIVFRGAHLSLTTNQAQAVKFLHEAYVRGEHEVSQDRITENLGIKTSRLRDTFRNSSFFGRGKLIAPGSRRGMVRLNISGPGAKLC